MPAAVNVPSGETGAGVISVHASGWVRLGVSLGLVVAVATSATTSSAWAQTGVAGGDAPTGILPGRPAVAVPRVEQPPTIDGRLDDGQWQNAARIGTFVQQSPAEGAPATEQTDVYVAYDNNHLYFGFHAHYSDAGMIRANRAERDQIFRDDLISVYFDTFVDQQRAYVFSVN